MPESAESAPGEAGSAPEDDDGMLAGSAPDDDDDGDDGGMLAGSATQDATTEVAVADDRCSEPDAIRCGSQDSERRICMDGRWESYSSCPVGTRCATVDGDAVCAEVVAACVGHEGNTVCGGLDQRLMYRCGPDGAALTSQICSDKASCEAGVADSECANCEPGTYRCGDGLLELCGSDQTFSPVMPCTCGGSDRCREKVCSPDDLRCGAGAIVERCSPDGTEWVATGCNPVVCTGSGYDAGVLSCQ